MIAMSGYVASSAPPNIQLNKRKPIKTTMSKRIP
jgi:hypothetical protein